MFAIVSSAADIKPTYDVIVSHVSVTWLFAHRCSTRPPNLHLTCCALCTTRLSVRHSCAFWQNERTYSDLGQLPFLVHPDWPYVIKKASTRLYFLKQLKKLVCPVVTSFLNNTYTTGIWVLSPEWPCALEKAQSESPEAVQKRAIHIHNLTSGMPYSSMLLSDP